MKKFLKFIFLLAVLTQSILADETSAFKDNFNNLNLWKPLLFPKIKNHTLYEVVELDSNNKVLKMVSNGSASGMVYQKEFDVSKLPILQWKWKINNIFLKINELDKSGDDFPIRVYVIFKYDSHNSSIFDRAMYETAKLVYGEYPPDSALNYVWASSTDLPKIFASPYSDKAMIIPVERGDSKLGQFIEYRVNILEDYRKAFKKDPPKVASLAIMSDSDNSKHSAVAYIDHIELSEE